MAYEPIDGLGSVAAFPRGLADVPGAALLRAAFGASLLNRDGVLVDVNDELARMLGYGRGELVGKNLLEIVHPDDHRLIARIHAGMRSGSMESDQTRRLYIRKDGEILHAVAGVVALRDRDGRLIGMLKQVQDVTRRVRAERDLQQSLERQRLVLDALAEGIIVYDVDGRARVSNPGAREILGVSARHLHGRRPQAPLRFAGDDDELIDDAALPVRQALRTGEPVKGHVLKVIRDDGEVRWIRINAQPLVHPGRDDTTVVASLADVTALKMRERELVHRDLHDPLTGLPNRRFFLGRLARVVAGRGGGGSPAGAVAAVDVARLSRVNDLYGRGAGEQVLAEVADRIAAAAEPGDMMARVGWDEFAVYLAAADSAEAATAATQRVVDALNEPLTVGGIRIAVSVDAAVTLLTPDESEAGSVLDRADAALRRARLDGLEAGSRLQRGGRRCRHAQHPPGTRLDTGTRTRRAGGRLRSDRAARRRGGGRRTRPPVLEARPRGGDRPRNDRRAGAHGRARAGAEPVAARLVPAAPQRALGSGHGGGAGAVRLAGHAAGGRGGALR